MAGTQESRKYESKHPFDSTKDRPSKVVAPVRRHGWNVSTLHARAMYRSNVELTPLGCAQLSSAQVESLRKAGQYASGLVKDVNMVAHTFKEFGMNVIKAHRLSPDAFFQMVRTASVPPPRSPSSFSHTLQTFSTK